VGDAPNVAEGVAATVGVSVAVGAVVGVAGGVAVAMLVAVAVGVGSESSPVAGPLQAATSSNVTVMAVSQGRLLCLRRRELAGSSVRARLPESIMLLVASRLDPQSL
jgi:hypothetical protein